MKISEINPGQGDIDVEAEVVSIEEPRSFNKFGRQLRVTNAVIKDDSGEIKLTLWNDDIDKVKPGNKIKITKGYAKEFNNEKQLTTGKFGSMEIIGEGEAPTPEESPQEELPAPSEEAMPEEAEQSEEVPDEDLL